MRRFTIAGIFSLALVGMANAQFFDPPALADRNGSQGFWFYMLEVPDPGAITIDAHSDDWGWFDPEYTLTMDEWRDEGDRPAPDRDDLFITTFMGWKGGDDNRWYCFLEAVDDVLAHAGTNIARWDGDMLQVGLDPQDHGRERSPASGYTMEWLMAPGDLSPPTNVASATPSKKRGPSTANRRGSKWPCASIHPKPGPPTCGPRAAPRTTSGASKSSPSKRTLVRRRARCGS